MADTERHVTPRRKLNQGFTQTDVDIMRKTEAELTGEMLRTHEKLRDVIEELSKFKEGQDDIRGEL